MTALYVILILIVPLLLSNSLIQGFELPKIIGFYLVTELMAVFLLIKDKRLFAKIDNWDILAVCYLLIATTSSLIAGNFAHSFLGGPYRYQGILTIFHLVLLFIVTRRVKPQKIGSLFILAGVVQSLILILQFVEINFLNLDITTYAGRAIGTMGQPGFVAGFLIVTLGFSLGKNIIPTILIILGIIATQSLGGILGIVVILPIYLLKTTKNKLYLIPLLILLVVVGILGLSKEKITINEVGTPRVESRLSIWPASFKLFLERPLSGYGAENIAYVFPAKFGGSSIDRAHNVLLDNLLTGGIFMGGIYLLLIAKGLKNTWKDPKLFPVFLALLGVVICDQVNVPGIANLITFWLLLGLAVQFVPRSGFEPE